MPPLTPPQLTAAFPIDPKDHIEGLARGLAVIESFDGQHGRMTASEVAARTGIARTAARRYLLTLCHYGFAQTDGKLFWLAPRVLRLGECFLDATRLPGTVQPAIELLSARTGQTVNVCVLDGHDVVYIARSNSPRLISIGFYPGVRVPAHVVTTGVVLLAASDESSVQQWVDEHTFTAFTPKTVTDKSVFMNTLRHARAQGYWIHEGHLDVGLQGVAVPLRNRQGAAVAALGITLHRESWPQERVVAELVPALGETAQSLRSLLR